MIPADANNKMGAYKFISWLVSKDGTTRARELTGNNYANKEAYNDPDFAQMSIPVLATKIWEKFSLWKRCLQSICVLFQSMMSLSQRFGIMSSSSKQ